MRGWAPGVPAFGGGWFRVRRVAVGDLEATASTGRRCSYGAEVSASYSGELRGDCSLLHKNVRGDVLEVRQSSGNEVERSKGWVVDGVDR